MPLLEFFSSSLFEKRKQKKEEEEKNFADGVCFRSMYFACEFVQKQKY